jgi:hypothetical protein
MRNPEMNVRATAFVKPAGSNRFRIMAAAAACLAIILLLAPPARAQHSAYLLGTLGLNGGSQVPEGIFYSNIWSWYHASGSNFAETGPLKCGPLDRVCLGLNVGGHGNLDLFVDQSIIGWTSPYKFIGANYGLFIDIPFALADASGAATVEPVLSFNRGSATGSGLQSSGGSTKGSIGNIYLEPINLGWHFSHLDLTISSGFIVPSGPYNGNARLNIGTGNAAGMFGLGGVAYADAEHTWALSIYTHYLRYSSQMYKNYTLGDVVPLEWGAGKTLNLNNDTFKEITIGAVGYAQWQTNDNQIDDVPTTKLGVAALNKLESTKSRIYAAGPSINLLTKYGLFSVRYYEEFGAEATPSGRQLMASVALLF